MWDKIADASIPKILTERVLLALLFLFLIIEDYLLITHRGNLSWLDHALPNISAGDVMYFTMSLALSWLFILPLIKTMITFVFIHFPKREITNMPPRLTISQLLAYAIDNDNSVAYQHLENHIKHVKTRQVINELYFYVLVAAIVNVIYEKSFTRHLWAQYPIGAFALSLLVIILGLAVGIIDNIENSDKTTDVSPKNSWKKPILLLIIGGGLFKGEVVI